MTLKDIERKILIEIVRNPRISDNSIARLTSIPLKTVNRKRKDLEKRGVVKYMAYVDNSGQGTSQFLGSQLYIITFRLGITRQMFFDSFLKAVSSDTTKDKMRQIRRHIHMANICERDGHLILMLHIESRVDQDIIEIYNSDIIPILYSYFGSDCIYSTETLKLTDPLLIFNNYMPLYNMKDGMLSPEVDSSFVMID
jgi:DNA-binding Lrp family transcriptional regulator